MTSGSPSLEDVVGGRVAELGLASPAGIERRRSDYSTSAPLDEVTVELADGTRLHLMAKKVGNRALLDAARPAKAHVPCSEVREPLVYTCLQDEVGPPEFWGVAFEADGPLLVLERVPGLALRHIGDLSLWRAAAAWVARFHARWAEAETAAPLRHHLLGYDRTHHLGLLQRAADRAEGPLPAVVVQQHAHAIDVLEALPTTVIHGELYASNVIVDPSTVPPRVAVIDWETAGIGSPFLDLAALVSGDWVDDERQAIIEAYRQASPLEMPPADFQQAVVAAELLISAQWMGWADGWQPPDDLACDWAGNAKAKASVLSAGGPWTGPWNAA